MDLYVLDANFNKIGMVDDYQSIIWTTRYFEPGEFEIQLPGGSQNVALLEKDNYIKRFDDDTVMIIERVEIITDVEEGNYILAAGRCLKSILDRRIVWQMQTYKGTPEAVIRSLITRNVISTGITARNITNFKLGDALGDTGTIEAQYTGDEILETIVELCKSYGYGFRILLNANNEFVFELFRGTDRSYLQTDNLQVIFAPEYDNLISTEYLEEKTYYKNVALIAGEGEGTARKYNNMGTASGLSRRELWVDANDIQSTYTDESGAEKTYTTAEYNAALLQRGSEKLAEVAQTIQFTGEVDTDVLYTYKEDFNLGDIVTVYNEYGIKSAPRITEIVESEDENGYKVLPTFEGFE